MSCTLPNRVTEDTLFFKWRQIWMPEAVSVDPFSSPKTYGIQINLQLTGNCRLIFKNL